MNESKYWFDIDGKKVADHEAMAAHFLEENILFLSSHKYVCGEPDDMISKSETLILHLNCSDVFAWAFADGENVSYDELPELFALYESNPKCGTIQWVCMKRNQKPQAPIVKYMKENNGWNEVMEALPENKYDAYCREKYGKSDA
jgi:hypothetical protein